MKFKRVRLFLLYLALAPCCGEALDLNALTKNAHDLWVIYRKPIGEVALCAALVTCAGILAYRWQNKKKAPDQAPAKSREQKKKRTFKIHRSKPRQLRTQQETLRNQPLNQTSTASTEKDALKKLTREKIFFTIRSKRLAAKLAVLQQEYAQLRAQKAKPQDPAIARGLEEQIGQLKAQLTSQRQGFEQAQEAVRLANEKRFAELRDSQTQNMRLREELKRTREHYQKLPAAYAELAKSTKGKPLDENIVAAMQNLSQLII